MGQFGLPKYVVHDMAKLMKIGLDLHTNKDKGRKGKITLISYVPEHAEFGLGAELVHDVAKLVEERLHLVMIGKVK